MNEQQVLVLLETLVVMKYAHPEWFESVFGEGLVARHLAHKFHTRLNADPIAFYTTLDVVNKELFINGLIEQAKQVEETVI